MPDNPLLELPDEEFRDKWPEVSRVCSERMRQLTPWVKSSIDGAERTAAKLERKGNGEDEAAPRPPPDPELLDLDELSDREPPEPESIVERWLAALVVALLSGHGGSAKSWLALFLAVRIALGQPFFGYQCSRRRVLFYAAEDRKAILHLRLHRICRHLGVRLADLAGWLYLYDATTSDNVVYWGGAESPAERLTARYDWLKHKVTEHEAGVLILDAVADLYDANENDRAKVKDFVRACLGLVAPLQGSVLLVAHVNRPTALSPTTTEGYSGSTAWHNAARARWYLRVDRQDEEAEGSPDDNLPRILELQKSNYGPAGATIRLLWDPEALVFRSDELSADGGIVASIRGANQRKAVLRLLAECEAIGRLVPSSPCARVNAATILGERDGYPSEFRGTRGRPRLYRLLRELQEAGLIAEAEAKNASRHTIGVWTITDAGRAETAA